MSTPAEVRVGDRVSLAAELTYNATELSVVGDVDSWSDGAFAIKIEDEIIEVGTRTGNDFTDLTRGAENTHHTHHPYAADVTHVVTGADLGIAVPDENGNYDFHEGCLLAGSAVFEETVEADYFASAGDMAGALPTVTFVSGTAKHPLGGDGCIYVPVTYNAASADAKLLVELSPDNVTWSTVGTITIPHATMPATGLILIHSFWLPGGFRLRLTATNAVIGTATATVEGP